MAFGHVALAFEAEAAVGEDFHAAGGELRLEKVVGGEDDAAGGDGFGGGVPEFRAAVFAALAVNGRAGVVDAVDGPAELGEAVDDGRADAAESP